MTDPTKPVLTVDGEEQRDVMDTVHKNLLVYTDHCAQELKITGMSVVLLSITYWMLELKELNSEAAERYLSALSVMANSTSHSRLAKAEDKRKRAVRDLMQSVDLDMSTPNGTA